MPLPPDPNDPLPWPDPLDPEPGPAGEEPFVVEPEPAFEVVPVVTCWRCGLRDEPDRGRCRKCQARVADEEDDWPPRRPAPARDPGANRVGTVILFYALFLTFSVIWAWVLHAAGPRMSEEDLLRGTAVLEVIDTILVLLALAKVGRAPLPAVSPEVRAAAWLAAVPVLAVVLGVAHVYTEALRDFLRQNGLQQPTMPLNGITILLVCVQPAVVEELFFRYVAFGAIYRATGLHTAVWVTAVMFAVAHIYNPLGMPYLFLVGAVLGYARAWGGLALPAVMHFFHNLAVLAIEGG